MDLLGDALKAQPAALDRDRVMRLHELKASVQRSDYVVDPPVVARAMLRHAVSQRRWWNPRTCLGSPPARKATPGGPSATVPTQLNGASDAGASLARQTHSS